MRQVHDVVVVGAGPSGAAAAYYAASAGLATVLVDRQTFPRSKVCGDGLSPRALRALDRMGLHDVATRGMRTAGIRVVDLRNGTRTSHEYVWEHDAFNFGVV